MTDLRRGGQLLLRRIDLEGHGHAWSGGAGGHPYCDRLGAPLTALCHGFLTLEKGRPLDDVLVTTSLGS